jgi:hypothetical protein
MTDITNLMNTYRDVQEICGMLISPCGSSHGISIPSMKA